VRESVQFETGSWSDAETIRLAQQGDPAAFERIYRLHSRRIHLLCLRMVRSPSEAEDLTQEAFLQLFRKLHTFRGESQFSSWLYRLVINTVLMRFRKEKQGTISLEDLAEPDRERIGGQDVKLGRPDARLSSAIDRISLERAVAQLPDGCRMMFILHDVLGYEHAEIAEIVECSVGNTKSQLHRARRRLRELLRKAWVQPHCLEAQGPGDEMRVGGLGTVSSSLRLCSSQDPGPIAREIYRPVTKATQDLRFARFHAFLSGQSPVDSQSTGGSEVRARAASDKANLSAGRKAMCSTHLKRWAKVRASLSAILTALAFLVTAVTRPTRGQVPAPAAPSATPDARPLEIDRGAAGLWQTLLKLHTRASLLMVTAHPDDEDGGMLTYESRGQGARVALLTLNRGEGGQNVMSDDFWDALGLVRTEELLAADRYYDVKQFWSSVVDFGFSKTVGEALSQWGHDRVLSDVVRVVRMSRPLVITSTFVGGPTDGHGHHAASGEMAQEVFRRPATRTCFPSRFAQACGRGHL
jgi:RNA polymerase sigma factor (sigma-70 family)